MVRLLSFFLCTHACCFVGSLLYCIAASAILALLQDDSDRTIQTYALQQLHAGVHLHWAEMSNEVSRIEELYEDSSFPERQLAALVASKVYYHLGALDEALSFALGAGDLFDIENMQDQYVDTLIGAFVPYNIFPSV